MYKSTRLAALIVSTLLVSSTFAGGSAHVEVSELVKSAAHFVGKPVALHGCLVKHFHGSFVRPCGSRDWHELVLIYDPNYRVPAVFQRLGIDYSGEVQGNFSGVIFEVEAAWPKPHKSFFLRLDSVNNAVTYQP